MESESGSVSRNKSGRIKALISLLGDDDRKIRKIAKAHLLELGDDATSLLDQTVREDTDGKTRIQARAILEQIRREELTLSFHILAMQRDEDIDLEKGVFLLARYAYPQLEYHEISSELNHLAHRVSEMIGDNTSAGKIVYSLNHVLFEEAGFRGNTDNYYSPENSFINKVLSKRSGIPISLSVVYLLVARRLGLPIYGVRMPMHLLCMYDQPPEPFYIDAYHRGHLMTRAECISFMKRAGVGFKESYLERASNREVLGRVLRNQILVYYHNEEDRKVSFLKHLLKILKTYS